MGTEDPGNTSAVHEAGEQTKLEIQKLKLECAKLDRELYEYKKPWWTRPSHLTLLITLLIGTGGLIQGLRTGYFDLQKQRMDLEADRQKLREEQIQAKAKDITLQEKSVLDRAKGLETARAAIAKQETALAKEKKSMADQLQSVKSEYAEKLSHAEEGFRAQRRQIEEEGQISIVAHRLDELKRNTTAAVNSPYALELIRLLQLQDGFKKQRLDLVRTALQSEARLSGKSVILFVLYRGTADESWKSALLSLLRTTLQVQGPVDNYGPNAPSGVLDGVAHDRWPDEEKAEIAAFMAGILEKAPQELRSDILWVYFSLGTGGFGGLDDFRTKHHREYLVAARTARDILLEPGIRHDALDLRAKAALQKISPQLFLVTLSQLLISDRAVTDQVFGSEVLQEANFIYSGQIRLDRDAYPKTLNTADWKSWIAKNEHYVELWLEPDLASFQADPGLLEMASKAWIAQPSGR